MVKEKKKDNKESRHAYKKKTAWEILSKEQIKKAFKFSDDYKKFLNEAKTERESIIFIQNAAKKANKWLEVASLISAPRRNITSINLSSINKQAKEGDMVVVPGKVLSTGRLDKQLKISAFEFSDSAKQKIRASGGKAIELESLIKTSEKNMRILK